jgi:hypothetical protein
MKISAWLKDGEHVQNFLMLAVEFPEAGRMPIMMKGHVFVNTETNEHHGIVKFFTVSNVTVFDAMPRMGGGRKA